MSRFWTFVYITDMWLLAAITLGKCQVGETISSVAFTLEADGKLLGKILRPTIDTIFWRDRDHCYGAWLTFQRITGATR